MNVLINLIINTFYRNSNKFVISFYKPRWLKLGFRDNNILLICQNIYFQNISSSQNVLISNIYLKKINLKFIIFIDIYTDI